MRSTRTRTIQRFRPESESTVEQKVEQSPVRTVGSGSVPWWWFVRRLVALAVVVLAVTVQSGCHGPLGDWLSRSSLVPGGVPPQTEPEIDFEMSEPEMTAEADDS